MAQYRSSIATAPYSIFPPIGSSQDIHIKAPYIVFLSHSFVQHVLLTLVHVTHTITLTKHILPSMCSQQNSSDLTPHNTPLDHAFTLTSA